MNKNRTIMTKDLMYCRAILKKVSFDPELFKKELLKAYRLLSPKDQLALSAWVKEYVQNSKSLRMIVLSDTDGLILG
jgi:type IV secretory pathway TrbF-like protein